MLLILLQLAGGLVALAAGGEMLVRGAVRVAERLGLSPLFVGLVLVGLGTSLPELATSVKASLEGSPGIALGNVVGSNITNILLILGVAAVIQPQTVGSRSLVRDGGVGAVAALLLVGIGLGWGVLSRPAGLFLLAGLFGYLLLAWRQERSGAVLVEGHSAIYDKAAAFEGVDPALRPQRPTAAIVKPLALCLIGLAVIVFGADLLVSGATALARLAGLTETVIGLTIVSVGTSLPELVTTLVAAIRRQGDLAVGNVLGSNIFNVLGIAGATGAIAPAVFPREIVAMDGPIMAGTSLLLILFAANGRISRIEGGLMLLSYAAFLAWLVTRG